MEKRVLGQKKTPISAIGYGAMSFSDFYGATDDEKSFAILDRCMDLGITHIDTSNVYGMGMSETRIGAYLEKQGKQGQDFSLSPQRQVLQADQMVAAITTTVSLILKTNSTNPFNGLVWIK